jgi:hypothetical protein
MGIGSTEVLDNGMEVWRCRIDHDGDDYATAVIHTPIKGSTMVAEVATIDCIPCEPDEYGDPAIVRSGEDSGRWRNVVLIANAPTMLDRIQYAEKKLDEIVNDGMKPGGLSETNHRLWCDLEAIRRELDRAADWATDVENF